MIHDGRDVSLSLSEKRYIRPFPWRERETPEGAALYWEWIVRKEREAGARLANDYTEVRFEELVRDPRGVLRRLSGLLEHDLNYDRIQENGIGEVFGRTPRLWAPASENSILWSAGGDS